VSLTEEQEKCIEETEMKFLRAIAGCTRVDRIINQTVGEELSIFDILIK